jgi:hypothetical protein
VLSLAASSIAKNGRTWVLACTQALRVISPPTPAGSPMVSASGAGDAVAVTPD